jgi:hypothetical protein
MLAHATTFSRAGTLTRSLGSALSSHTAVVKATTTTLSRGRAAKISAALLAPVPQLKTNRRVNLVCLSWF